METFLVFSQCLLIFSGFPSSNASGIQCKLMGESGNTLTFNLHQHTVRLPDRCPFTVISVYSPLTVENKSSFDLSYQQFIKGDNTPKVIHHKKGGEPILMTSDTTAMKMRIDDKQNWKSGWLPVSLTGDTFVPFSREGIPHPLQVKHLEGRQRLGKGTQRITATITDVDISKIPNFNSIFRQN